VQGDHTILLLRTAGDEHGLRAGLEEKDNERHAKQDQAGRGTVVTPHPGTGRGQIVWADVLALGGGSARRLAVGRSLD
jgi:hypothetical protein